MVVALHRAASFTGPFQRCRQAPAALSSDPARGDVLASVESLLPPALLSFGTVFVLVAGIGHGICILHITVAFQRTSTVTVLADVTELASVLQPHLPVHI